MDGTPNTGYDPPTVAERVFDDDVRPLATRLGVRGESTNELLSDDADGDEEAFVETIVESPADEPANSDEIKRINREATVRHDVEDLELGPHDCAAN